MFHAFTADDASSQNGSTVHILNMDNTMQLSPKGSAIITKCYSRMVIVTGNVLTGHDTLCDTF